MQQSEITPDQGEAEPTLESGEDKGSKISAEPRGGNPRPGGSAVGIVGDQDDGKDGSPVRLSVATNLPNLQDPDPKGKKRKKGEVASGKAPGQEPAVPGGPISATSNTNGSGPTPVATGEGEQKTGNPEVPSKKHPLTWDRGVDILKLVATIWVAVMGSVVTMQFNERQHELSRIEAISKMLPNIASAHGMARDGAIWAIFRTANNRTMLRDLASLFPEDIYRVVSSIALAGELDHDPDAVMALQISSEKLAFIYSGKPETYELASRLYHQAIKLRERKPEDNSPLHVVDLSTELDNHKISEDQKAHLARAINDLAEQHLREGEAVNSAAYGHGQAKELFRRVIHLGGGSPDQQVQIQVARAKLAIAAIYVKENLLNDAVDYLKAGLRREARISGNSTDNISLKSLDRDGDGFADKDELGAGVQAAQERLQKIESAIPEKGVAVE